MFVKHTVISAVCEVQSLYVYLYLNNYFFKFLFCLTSLKKTHTDDRKK